MSLARCTCQRETVAPYFKILSILQFISYFKIGNNFHSIRLDQEDDDYLIISRMFANRGGVVYVKKIMNWIIEPDQI